MLKEIFESLKDFFLFLYLISGFIGSILYLLLFCFSVYASFIGIDINKDLLFNLFCSLAIYLLIFFIHSLREVRKENKSKESAISILRKLRKHLTFIKFLILFSLPAFASI